MEYVTYILFIMVVMSLCLLVFRRKGDLFDARRARRFAKDSTGPELTDRQTRGKSIPASRLSVPTPWGWPGNGSIAESTEERSVSESLHRFVDHLIAEKQTVDDSEYLLRRNESLKSLIEDRHGKLADGRKGSLRTGKHATGPVDIAVIGGQRQLKEVRTPWGW